MFSILSIKKYKWIFLFSTLTFVFSCDKNDNDLNIFSIEDDKALGEQLAAEIASDPTNYPILSRSQYPQAYQHLERIINPIMNSGKLNYKDEFLWEFSIIHDDSVLNAFAGPGGKVYVYTGLIKYLDSEDHLAGVMGHEIAHADRRHVTDQMTKQYGISFLLEIALGKNPGALGEIAAGLAFLKFSRNAEREADDFSVVYLCPTEYKADGAAGFFEKLISQGQSGGGPEFLSTHPDPGNRVQDIRTKAAESNCPGTNNNITQYQAFKNSLP
ncbi:MAG: M48 family metalloprotease [Bacteroidia bacterium]